MLINPAGYSEEERRIKQRLLELGLQQKHVADALKLHVRDVNAVVKQCCRSPRYVKEVYGFLGLEMPKNNK